MSNRRWTSRQQTVAEVAAACGVNMSKIGRTLGADPSVVRYHLIPGAIAKRNQSSRQWRAANPERQREAVLRWNRANPERIAAYARDRGPRSREYWSYYGMLKRCTNPAADNYPRYGGRGITICTRWCESFESFLSDMGPCPGPEYTLERVDNNGPYEQENCCWATAKVQGRNKRNNRHVAYRGQTMTFAQAVEESGLTRERVRGRLRLGWSVDEAFEVVPRKPRPLACDQTASAQSSLAKTHEAGCS